MFEKLIPLILKKYDLGYKTISSVQSGYRNSCYKVLLRDGSLINVVIYKDEADILSTIKRANEISQYAASQGMATRKNISPRLLCLRIGHKTHYVSIYNYLPGQTIPWEAYTKKHIKLLGQAMSDLHFCLKPQAKDSSLNQPIVTDGLKLLCNNMKQYFSDATVRRAMKQKLNLVITEESFNHFLSLLKLSEHLKPTQPLHMDFVRGNLLFQEHSKSSENKLYIKYLELSGILDFEKTAHGHVVFDIARTLAFLVVDCTKYSEEKITKYFLVSGYNKRGKNNFKRPVVALKNNEYDLLQEYTKLFLLHDFYKFLRHNPYESLDQNHHFKRTRNILLQRNMVKYS